MDKPATQRDVIVWGCLACAYGAHGLVGWALIALAAITMVMPRPTPEAKERTP